MQAVILAAGKGSRLHPITTRRSKAMLPIVGQPIVERVMEGLAHNGVDEFILVVSPDDTDIVTYFDQESPLRGRALFVEQKERWGMAHALCQAAPYLRGQFVLSACDNLVSEEHIQELIAVHGTEPLHHATLSLMKVSPELISRTGIVEMSEGFITRIVEKPKPSEARSDIASLPLYVFTLDILDYVRRVPRSPRGEFELQDAIQMLIDDGGKVRGVLTQSRLTLTAADDLLDINRYYLNGDLRLHLVPYTVGPNTQLITPLRIESDVTIGADCVIGPRVYIERDCTVGSNTTIRDAVVLRGSVVPAGSVIEGQVVS